MIPGVEARVHLADTDRRAARTAAVYTLSTRPAPPSSAVRDQSKAPSNRARTLGAVGLLKRPLDMPPDMLLDLAFSARPTQLSSAADLHLKRVHVCGHGSAEEPLDRPLFALFSENNPPIIPCHPLLVYTRSAHTFAHTDQLKESLDTPLYLAALSAA